MGAEMIPVAGQGRLEGGLEGLPPGRGDPVNHPPPPPFVFNQPSAAENLQVVGDAGLLQLQDERQLADAQRPLEQEPHDPQPDGIGQGFEETDSVRRALFRHGSTSIKYEKSII